MNSLTHPPKDHRERLSVNTQSWLIWLVGFQLLVLFWPTLVWLWQRWTMGVWHNGHSVLIVILVIYLVASEIRKQNTSVTSSCPWGFAIVIPALFLHMLDTGIHSELLSAFALYLSLPGFSLLFLGLPRTKAILFPLLMLFLTLPIPLVFTESLHLGLRQLATNSVAWILHHAGVPVYASGTTLEFESATLQVADACSGFSTLYATITVAIMTAYYCPNLLRKIAVLLLAAPLAIAVNIVRILILTLLVKEFGLDVLNTSAHELSGLLTFVIALPLIFWIGQESPIADSK
ncbi:MAG: exosortase/archaeosortase family protein [Methylococcaceae bacterium]|jgi:exosortase